MRKLRSLTGMAVVCGSRRIGRVLQAELTADLRQLAGIWVASGLLGTRFIPAERIELLGQVAVMADDRGKRRPMQVRSLFKRAVSTDGRRMGAITGAEIDELSFAVCALELSAGLWDDLAYRRRRVTRYTVNPDNGEIVIGPAEAMREEGEHEGRLDEGPDHRHADRRICGDGVRHHELADGEALEPEGPADGKLDL